MNREAFIRGISPFVPPTSAPLLFDLVKKDEVKLKITKERKSKFGDYRPPYKGKPQQITVNGNLNPYAFLITFIHEVAHLKVFQETRSLKNPHGKSWKKTFQRLGAPFLKPTIFPNEVLIAFEHYLENPKASTLTDTTLYLALKKFDKGNDLTLVQDLAVGARFHFKAKEFEKVEKRRKRILCKEIKTGKQFLFSPLAEVDFIK